MASDQAPGSFENERKLYTAKLRSQWSLARWIDCSFKAQHACLPWSIYYGMFGMSYRAEERKSFELAVTPMRVLVTQTIYNGGMCCRTRYSTNVPYSDIDRVALEDDCCCGPKLQLIATESAMAAAHAKAKESGASACCLTNKLYEGLCLENPSGGEPHPSCSQEG